MPNLKRPDPRAVLEANKAEAQAFSQRTAPARTRSLFKTAAESLEKRLAQAEGLSGPGKNSFSAAQLRATLAQVKAELRPLVRGIGNVVIDASEEAAGLAAEHSAAYLASADEAFRGVGQSPLAIHEASMFERATSGVRATVLRRIATGHKHGHHKHHARLGVLERYGVETIGNFEDTLQAGLVAKKSWAEMREDITEQSPFLQGAPRHWGERIVRTEVMGAYGRAADETAAQADEDHGGAVKIWSETFDDRTAADSYLTHGQIRRPEEDFATPFGPVPAPPMRPNDRAIIVTHLIAWVIPVFLRPRSDAEAMAAWRREGRKGAPPPRPQPQTTVPLASFGKG